MDNSFEYKDVFFAYLKAKKSRKNKQEIYIFDQNREERLKNIFDELKNKTYKHSEYKKIIINDGKKRYIYSPIFRDHIVHHLLYAKIYNAIDNNFLENTFACRKSYGSHKAIHFLQNSIQNQSGIEKKYYLKIDFSKYFFSIHHDILKFKLMNFIEKSDLFYIASLVIDSYQSPDIYDELLAKNIYYTHTKQKWLPIWSITSQLFANFYLSEFDKHIKDDLKLDFVRYMDDIVIIWNKEELHSAKLSLLSLAEKNQLIIHPKKVSFNLIADGVNFVWYKILNNKIYVSRKTANRTNKFLDILETMDLKSIGIQDSKKITNILHARLWNFKHSSFWLNYFHNRKIVQI